MLENKTTQYYQYQGVDGQPVFLKFDSDEMEKALFSILSSLGFEKVESEQLKNIPVNRVTTKVLSLTYASPIVVKEIRSGSHNVDAFGTESIFSRGTYNVYKYKNVGMMVFSPNNTLWELGIVSAEQNHTEIKIMLSRFISWALAPLGIVGLWAVPVEEGIVVMKPIDAKYEVVFIDLEKMVTYTQDGTIPISNLFQLIRLDESLKQQSRQMSPEQLLSFLSTHTTYFSVEGLDFRLNEALYKLVQLFEGVILPIENFKPRATQTP